jgi:DNA adenine methylase
MKVKPLISWPGGKSRLLKHLLPYISQERGYIEVFAGGCALLLAKDRSTLEVANDLNGDIINLFRVANYHPDELSKEMSRLPSSRELLAHSVALLRTDALTDVQRAARFLYANKASFAGTGTSLAIARAPESRAFLGTAAIIERITAFSQRFDKVIIENLDYRRCLRLYDHPGNLFFLDPPYLDSKASNYRGWTQEEMQEFHDHVIALHGHWIVTVDDSLFNRQLWHGHDILFLTTANGATNKAKDPGKRFGEMIIYGPGIRPAAAIAKAA